MSSLHHQLVRDWLLDFKKLDKSSHGDIHTYCIKVENDSATASALFKVLEDQKSHDDFLECICDQLFNYYRSKESRLKVFTISFIPVLIGLHLDQMRRGFPDQKKYHCVDVMLLGIYNLEVVNEDGNTVERKFRLPFLAKPSVYHEPSTHSLQIQSALTENALQKLETPETMISSFGPYSEHDSIISSTRMNILTVLLKVYNNHLSSVPKESLHSLCKTCVKVLIQPNQCNFKTMNDEISSPKTPLVKYSEVISKGVPRIQPTSQFLVELSSSVHFCLFNDVIIDGRRALERIHSTALYYLFSDVLMMTHAIKNSLRMPCYSASEESEESPEALTLAALSPTSNVTTNVAPSGLSKTAITNASFKTKKLPDDIPIVPLNSVEEVAEEALSDSKDSKKDTKNSSKEGKEKERGQTPPTAIILKTIRKNRERMREMKDSFHIKLKPNMKPENGDDKKLCPMDEIASVSSGVSDTKSIGSESEMIPLTSMNRATINTLANTNSPEENGFSNGTDLKLRDVSSPLITEAEKPNSASKSNERSTSGENFSHM